MKDYSVLLTCGEATMVVIHDAFDKGYQQGYANGKKASCDCKDNMEAEYNRGLNEAWEVARKLFIVPTDALMELFDTKSPFLDFSAQEVIAKIKEYEESQKEDEPQTGHWIFDDECKEHGHCSRCGYGSVDLVNGEPHNFCRKCGVKMVKPQESEVRNDKRKSPNYGS